MPAATEEQIKEVLKFDPLLTEQKRQTDDSIIDEVLKFDPGREEEPVGGTFEPTEERGFGEAAGTPGRYVPGEEPEADFGTLMSVAGVDDPVTKAKIFAKARDIPLSGYRIKEGKIEFRNSYGQWQREVGDLPQSKLKNALAEIIAHPSTYLGTAGAAAGGVPGAVIGAVTGAIARKVHGAVRHEEPSTTTGLLLNFALEGLLALGGETVGKLLKFSANRFLTRKAGGLKYAGREVTQGMLTPKEHAQAAYIKSLADKHGITLAPHQLYDKEGMTNVWKYLRKHPVTADSIRTFEDKLAEQTDEAITSFINDLGGFDRTPYEIGKRAKDVAGEVIEGMERGRTAAVSPDYKKAFAEAGPVDISSVVSDINKSLKAVPRKSSAERALTRIKTMLTREVKQAPAAEPPPTLYGPTGRIIPIEEIAKPPKVKTETRLEVLDNVKKEIDAILDGPEGASIHKDTKFKMAEVKRNLTAIMDEASPEYAAARRQYEILSDPIKRLKESVIGQIADLRADKPIAGVPQKLLSPTNMPDAKLLTEARKIIEKQDPELWDNIVGGYIRDTYEGLMSREDGKVFNAVGKLYKQLYGTRRKRDIMNAALPAKARYEFESLMKVFQRAAVGTSTESTTATQQAIAATFEMIPGSQAYRFGMFPRQATTEMVLGKWNDIIMVGRQADLLSALTDKNVLKEMKKLKRLPPKSERFIESFAVFTALVSEKLRPTSLPETPEIQRPLQ